MKVSLPALLLTVLLLGFASIPDAWASDTPGQASMYFGAGLFTSNIGRVTRRAEAETRTIDTVYPEVDLSLRWMLSRRWGWFPAVAYTPIGQKAGDGAATKTVLVVALPAVYSPGILDFKIGPGFLLHRIHGNGGRSIQKNGSSTAVFYYPSSSTNTSLVFLDLGLGVELGRVRIDLDGMGSALLSARRTLSAMAQLSFQLF